LNKGTFSIIRYANCWEDTEALLKALNIKKDGVYLSVISGGDNTFSLLTDFPGKVIGVDISKAQIALFHLKKKAIEKLNYDEVLQFLGIYPFGERISVYKRIASELPAEYRDFWNNNLDKIENGIVFEGKFEKYFKVFRRYVIPLVHNRETIEILFANSSKKTREEFFYKKWDSFRWKLMFKIFFSRFVMGRLGRAPEFFDYVKVPVAKNIKKRVDRGLINIPARDNPYIDFILHGNFKYALPHYLRRKNFEIIKSNLYKLVIVQGPVQEGLKEEKYFDGYNLSDIFEYLDCKTFREIYKSLLEQGKRGCKFVYWNMLADRECPSEFQKFVKFHDRLSNKLLGDSKAFFYKKFVIEEKI
jgi:S-adenosylmethionine-diacylglycerol 3-amino-3-carboxypropyl transferase